MKTDSSAGTGYDHDTTALSTSRLHHRAPPSTSMSVILQGQGSKVPSRAAFKQERDLVGASSNVGIHLRSVTSSGIQVLRQCTGAAGYKPSVTLQLCLFSSCSSPFKSPTWATNPAILFLLCYCFPAVILPLPLTSQSMMTVFLLKALRARSA